MLGIPKEAQGPFPEDRRLDVEITCQFPDVTRQREFEIVSRTSRVPLRLAPQCGPLGIIRGQLEGESLRRRMALQAETLMATGVAEPDGGYRLVPAKDRQGPKLPHP